MATDHMARKNGCCLVTQSMTSAMKQLTLAFITAGHFLMAASALSQTVSPWEAALVKSQHQIELHYPIAALSHELRHDMALTAREYVQEDQQSTGVSQGVSKRSVARAAIYSVVIPGTGQFYNHSYLKGAAFLGFEVLAWMLHTNYNQEGDNKTTVFENYADAHWSEQAYWQSIADDCGCPVDDRARLREHERDNFSHFLPDTKNQTYYENVGKYDQFNAGWDDSISGEIRKRDSQNRLDYNSLRTAANDEYKNATLWASLALINHLASAFEAGWSAHRYNQTHFQARLGFRLREYQRDLIPTVAVNLQW